MKWTSFADRLPPNIEEAHMRYADGHEKLVYDYYSWMKEVNTKVERAYDIKTGTTPTPEAAEWIHFGQWGSGGRYDFSELEWLDESEQTIEESRCCEQNDKLRAEIYKLSKLPEDRPLGDHFLEIRKWIPISNEIGYDTSKFSPDLWDGINTEVKENFEGLLHIVPPEYQDILRLYFSVIDSLVEKIATKEAVQATLDFGKEFHKKGI